MVDLESRNTSVSAGECYIPVLSACLVRPVEEAPG